MTSSIREVLQLSEMEGPKPGTLKPASCWGHWFLLVFICFYNPFTFVLADVFGWNKRLRPEFILRWKKRNIERQVRTGIEDGWKNNMEDISLLSRFCRASWFDQWVRGTAKLSREQVYVCAESPCAFPSFLGYRQRIQLNADEQEGGD